MTVDADLRNLLSNPMLSSVTVAERILPACVITDQALG